MVFEAKNSPNGVSIDGKSTQVPSLSGQKTESEGVVVIHHEKSTYIPNFGKDTKAIVEEVSQAFLDLALVAPITGAGPTAALNPQFATKLTELGNKIKALGQELA